MGSSTVVTNYQIHSRPSGPHWIAWLTRPGEEKPVGSVVLVGETREEAEARAREWASQIASGASVPLG